MNIIRKRLIRKLQSNAPGNDTIPQSVSDSLLKRFNKELFDENKWVRFVMTGKNQGCEGQYGYWIEKIIINNELINCIPHYYYVEQHSFQTPGKQTKNTKYQNVFLDCEVDADNNIISNINVKPGSDIFPLKAMSALSGQYNINTQISAKLCGTLQDTKISVQKEIDKLMKG